MEFSALGSRCPHYGVPLSKGSAYGGQWGEAILGGKLSPSGWGGGSIAGVLRGHRLRCPWHGSCFNIRTGDIEEYPSLDCLPCFKVISGLFPPAWSMSPLLPTAYKHGD